MTAAAYLEDFYAWTREQARAIRAGRGGENAFDRENVAEEIESLGASERSACESALELIIEHLLKIEYVGPMEPVRWWRQEVRAFRKNLERKLSPSLRTELSTPERLDALYASARRDLLQDLEDDDRSVDLPAERPYDWMQLTSREAHWFPEPRHAAG